MYEISVTYAVKKPVLIKYPISRLITESVLWTNQSGLARKPGMPFKLTLKTQFGIYAKSSRVKLRPSGPLTAQRQNQYILPSIVCSVKRP